MAAPVLRRQAPGPRRTILGDGRQHLADGPIDLIIDGEGPPAAKHAAFGRAAKRFDGLLAELVAELPLLRTLISKRSIHFQGPVAKRMANAVRPHFETFVTPMAAVAGSVADEVLAAMTPAPGLQKAYVNNGGDIAAYVTPGAELTVGIVSSLAEARPDGSVTLTADSTIRGIATSGRHGRSFSLGIADAVTVLARNAAEADAAATLIANAVDVDHPAIERALAVSLDPDSDLGDRLVTVDCGRLPAAARKAALDAGVARAESFLDQGLAIGILLHCQGETRCLGAEETKIRLPKLQTAWSDA